MRESDLAEALDWEGGTRHEAVSGQPHFKFINRNE